MSEGRNFDDWFRDFNKWGLSHDQLLTCAFTPGNDPGDTVWTDPQGNQMTRHMCSRWIDFYSAALTGWNAKGEQK